MNLPKESELEKMKAKELESGTGFWKVTGTIIILSYIVLWLLTQQ